MKNELKIGMTTLCYIQKDDSYLMLYRNKKENDINEGKWIGVGGHFELEETPEECMKREVMEETGLTVTSWKYKGLVTFVAKDIEIEYMHLFVVDGFEGEIIDCNEGELHWKKIDEIQNLNLWEGDKIFLRLMRESETYFSLKLVYEGNQLVEAVNMCDGTNYLK